MMSQNRTAAKENRLHAVTKPASTASRSVNARALSQVSSIAPSDYETMYLSSLNSQVTAIPASLPPAAVEAETVKHVKAILARFETRTWRSSRLLDASAEPSSPSVKSPAAIFDAVRPGEASGTARSRHVHVVLSTRAALVETMDETAAPRRSWRPHAANARIQTTARSRLTPPASRFLVPTPAAMKADQTVLLESQLKSSLTRCAMSTSKRLASLAMKKSM